MFTQFLGAANDNAFKLVVTFVVLNTVIVGEARGTAAYMSLVGAVFVAPFLLFSTFAGDLADRFSKRTVIVWSKVAEIVVMGLGAGALWLGHIPMCLLILFLMGAQSTFFSPAKYGILPEMLENEDLSEGNGIIQMMTDIAIISGMIVGSLLLNYSHSAGLVFVFIAVIGTAASPFVGKTPAAAPGRRIRGNAVEEMWNNIRAVRRDRPLFLCIIGASFFWLMGACFQINFLVYGKSEHLLAVSDDRILGGLLALTALGIGLGALLAGKLSGKKVELGLVPIGAAIMAIFSLDLYFAWKSLARTGADMFLLGFGGGFYIVPLSAFIQQRAPADKKGMVLATNNFISFSAILLASGIYFLVGYVLEIGPAGVFAGLSLLVILVAGYIFWLLPDFLLRFCLWLLAHCFYRMHVRNPERVPREGGALLVCDQATRLDALLVLASIQRFVRFVVLRRSGEKRMPQWFSRALGVIYVDEGAASPDATCLLGEAVRAIGRGELVCLFAADTTVPGGDATHFQLAYEQIVKSAEVPVIPVCIAYLGRSRFEKRLRIGGGRALISYGGALPLAATAGDARRAIRDLDERSQSSGR